MPALLFLLLSLLAAEAVLDALKHAAFVSIFAFSFFPLALVEDLVELLFVDLISAGASALSDPLLEAVDVLHVSFLLLVLLGLLVCLNGLVELLVLKLLLFLLEGLNLLFLLQESALDLGHLLISFEHFSEKVVRATDRNFGLQENLHALSSVLPRHVVESHLSLDIIVHRQGFGQLERLGISYWDE